MISSTLQNTRITLTSNAPFTQTYVTSHLTQSSDPVETYASRVQGRHFPLVNPPRESKAKKESSEKRERRKKAKEKKKERSTGMGMGKREAKEKGVWKLDEAHSKFALLTRFLRPFLSDLRHLPDFLFSCLCITFGWDTCLSSLICPNARQVLQHPNLFHPPRGCILNF